MLFQIVYMKICWIVILTTIAITAAACGQRSANSVNNANTVRSTPEPTPFDELAFGRQIYSVSCGTCHKQDGTGGKVTIAGRPLDVADLTSAKAKAMDDDKLLKVIFDGIPDDGMPAFKDRLSEPQIREVVKFVRTGIQKSEPVANPTASN